MDKISGASPSRSAAEAPITGAPNTFVPELDQKESERGAKLGNVYQQMEAKFGEKEVKHREIKKTLDKDDFLKIMISQMKNQDPTNPFKPEQMASELAQFSSVEQLHNVNQNLTKMTAQNKPFEQLTMTNLIGKMVTVTKDKIPHIQGQGERLSFTLPKDAASVKVTLLSDSGEVAFEKDLGSQKQGEVTLNWDGKKSNLQLAGSGNFFVRVEAHDERDRPVEVNPQSRAKVIGVSFEHGEPIFLVGDSKRQDKVPFENIVRVEMADDASMELGALGNAGSLSRMPGQAPLSSPGVPAVQGRPVAAPAVQASTQGSHAPTPFSPSHPPTRNSAPSLASNDPIAAQAAASPVNAAPTSPSALHHPFPTEGSGDRGFPNGLTDSDTNHTNLKKGGNN